MKCYKFLNQALRIQTTYWHFKIFIFLLSCWVKLCLSMTVQSATASISELHAANFVYICHIPLHATWLLQKHPACFQQCNILWPSPLPSATFHKVQVSSWSVLRSSTKLHTWGIYYVYWYYKTLLPSLCLVEISSDFTA